MSFVQTASDRLSNSARTSDWAEVIVGVGISASCLGLD
jgi:hypothetical protein